MSQYITLGVINITWFTFVVLDDIYRRCVDLFSKARTGDKLPW